MYLDRGVLSSLVPALQDDRDIHMSEFQSGILGSAFMLGYMLASPFFAYASQSIHPFTLIAVGISVWGGSVLLAAVSRTFWLLVVARTISGIGEASFVCLAAPILLAIAPAAKKNIWISFFYSALTIGYALGYAIVPPIKNGFNGWYYVFYIEAVASIPFVLIALFAYKDPSLIFKKEVKVSIGTQLKLLSQNSVYIFLVLGYGAYSFTVGGIAYWGPTMLQKQFEQSETVATLSLAFITIISGLVATILGSVALNKMTKQYLQQNERGEISNTKFNYFRTEKASKWSFLVASISCASVLLAAIIGPTLGHPMKVWPFIFFLTFVAIGEFFLFM